MRLKYGLSTEIDAVIEIALYNPVRLVMQKIRLSSILIICVLTSALSHETGVLPHRLTFLLRFYDASLSLNTLQKYILYIIQ